MRRRSRFSRTLSDPLGGLVLAASLALTPLATQAQQTGTVPRVSCLLSGSGSAQAQSRVEAFRQGLRERGYVEGQNIVIAVESLGEKVERFPSIAAELVRRKPDVIVAASNAAVAALKQATHTVPIVAAIFGDPVGRTRRQPRAAGREHYRIIERFGGDLHEVARTP